MGYVQRATLEGWCR